MPKTFQLAIVLLLPAVLAAQVEQVHLRVVNGTTGKPIPNQRILFFGNGKAKPINDHEFSFEATTDEHGLATIPIDPARTKWFTAFPDFMTGCTPDPNNHFYSVQDILTSGVSAPNNCSTKIKQAPEPHYFIFFARKPTLRERMNW